MTETSIIPEHTHNLYVKTLEDIVKEEVNKKKKKKAVVTVVLCAAILSLMFVSAFAGKNIYQSLIRFHDHDEIVISDIFNHITISNIIPSTDYRKIPMTVAEVEKILCKHLPGVDSDQSYEIAYEAQTDANGNVPLISIWAADYYTEGNKTVSLFVKALTQYADSRYANEEYNSSGGKLLKNNNYFDNLETVVVAYSYDDLPSRTEVEFYYEDMWFHLIFNHFTDSEIADIISRIH